MRALLRDAPSTASRDELNALASESDPLLAAEGLFSLAQRQEQAGQIEFAAEIYQSLSQSPTESPYQQRAHQRLEALSGRGAFGARFEVLSRNFASQASDPAMLGGMFLASAVFQTVRLATLSRLAASPSAGLLTRGLGARTLSWSAGFALEFPTFTLATRGIHQALGNPQDWSRRALGRDLLASGLTLFLLKSFGATGSALTRRFASGETALARFTTAAMPQASAFTGIFASHVLESRLGLRAHSDVGNILTDSFATLLQFHVGGRLLHQATGGSYDAALELHRRRIETSAISP
ncbi:MAG: hypothetical protein K8R69_06280, partial [Deltaproteobacteria bacterium]|nr:hypothetical protein [Deltaproteobacteria bacterium]